jgi:hypothetical protein
MGTGVFIALRPDIFGVPNEHVTVEWVGHFPEWNTLLHKIQAWECEFDFDVNKSLRVEVNGYANWMGKEDYHRVALVRFKNKQELSFRKNWHITLESSKIPFETADTVDELRDRHRYDWVDNLWLGYKDANNDKQWLSLAGETLDELKVEYERNQVMRELSL